MATEEKKIVQIKTDGGDSSTSPVNTSAVRDFKVVTYNCKNMDTAHPVFEELSKSVDVVLVQEHWYFDCQLDRLNTACQKYIGCGKAVDTGDPILPVQMPRGYGGVAVIWKDKINHLINKLPDGGNRIQCVELGTDEPLLLISVYTAGECRRIPRLYSPTTRNFGEI